MTNYRHTHTHAHTHTHTQRSKHDITIEFTVGLCKRFLF